MTKEQFIDKYNGKAVWCKTEELAREFLKEASMFGFKWYPEDELTKYSNYHHYNNKTCYFADKIDFTIAYEDLEHAKNNGYKIIKYKPEEKPKNLIPQIAKMLGVEIGEEFTIKQTGKQYVFDDENGLMEQVSKYVWEEPNNSVINALLLGEYTIQKLPKKPQLTNAERVILENLTEEYPWITRDNRGMLLLHCKKPDKSKYCWISDAPSYRFYVFNHLFQFIKWENEEPYNIEELLKGE